MTKLTEPGTGTPDDHDHSRPDIGIQRAVIKVARAVLGRDPGAAAEAAESASCATCTTVSGIQLGFAMIAEVAGESGPFISTRLQRRISAMLDAAEGEIGSASN